MIDKNKQYETMDGSEVRIYATDGKGGEIHGAVLTDGGWIVSLWDKDGNHPTLSDWDLIEEWEPKVGEWCLFHNGFNTALLARFSHVSKIKYVTEYATEDGFCFACCERFIGELPQHLKGDIEVVSPAEFDEGEG